MSDKEVIEVLKQVPLFQNLDKKNLGLISKITSLRHYEKGDTIISQSEAGIGFYLIKSGKVEVLRNTNDKQLRLAEMGAGEFFGEMALFEDTPRSATIVAMEPTDCYIVVRWHFMGTLEEAPTIAAQMLPVIIKRLQKTQELL